MNRYELVTLYYIFLNLFYISRKTHKQVNYCFFHKNWVSLFISAKLSFPLNDIKKTIYSNVPEMLNFDQKTSIQKYPIFCSWYNCFGANVSDFYRFSLLKIKNFELSYLFKQLSYTNTFTIELTCFKALYNILKCEKILNTFFFRFFDIFYCRFHNYSLNWAAVVSCSFYRSQWALLDSF